jgi:hypothetical protein
VLAHLTNQLQHKKKHFILNFAIKGDVVDESRKIRARGGGIALSPSSFPELLLKQVSNS